MSKPEPGPAVGTADVLAQQPVASAVDDNMSIAGEEDPGAALDTSGLRP